MHKAPDLSPSLSGGLSPAPAYLSGLIFCRSSPRFPQRPCSTHPLLFAPSPLLSQGLWTCSCPCLIHTSLTSSPDVISPHTLHTRFKATVSRRPSTHPPPQPGASLPFNVPTVTYTACFSSFETLIPFVTTRSLPSPLNPYSVLCIPRVGLSVCHTYIGPQ